MVGLNLLQLNLRPGAGRNSASRRIILSLGLQLLLQIWLTLRERNKWRRENFQNNFLRLFNVFKLRMKRVVLKGVLMIKKNAKNRTIFQNNTLPAACGQIPK